jgi:alcohol dehydrogenase class IV
MEKINFYQPQKLVFGEGCFSQFVRDLKETKLKRLFILTVPFLRDQIDQAFGSFAECNITISINSGLNTEPGFSHYYQLLEEARVFQPDGVIGIGGGSVLDLSKLLAAMICNDQKLEEVVGIGLLNQRALFLACLPTTSGTGSEVSPNAILLNESDNMKKGIISPFLVPDYTCIDPLLTIGVPPDLTASTAIDALTHCLEAFTNRFAHPMVDLYALEGIRLISKNLVKGFNDGSDIEARTALSLGSLYGGLCLGPVNTAAVHALSYPLGSQFKVPHGLANALLLPYIMEYNIPAAVGRYCQVALALGAEQKNSEEETALEGVAIIRKLMEQCKLPNQLSQIAIPEDAIPEMARSAIKIQRLLKNNVRQILVEDAIRIYKKAY